MIILIGMIVVGIFFEIKVFKDFLLVLIFYILGIGVVFLVVVLSYWNKDIFGSVFFLVVVVLLFLIYFF